MRNRTFALPVERWRSAPSHSGLTLLLSSSFWWHSRRFGEIWVFKALACGVSIGVTLASWWWFASSEILGCRGVQELLMHTQSAQSCRQSIPPYEYVHTCVLVHTCAYGLRTTEYRLEHAKRTSRLDACYARYRIHRSYSYLCAFAVVLKHNAFPVPGKAHFKPSYHFKQAGK